MIELTVNDMTCNHCVGRVTKAIQGVDAQAKVEIDLASKRVQIDSAAPAESLIAAVKQAGYTPQPGAA
jgi:copper chaperone CopZ